MYFSVHFTKQLTDFWAILLVYTRPSQSEKYFVAVYYFVNIENTWTMVCER
jgi:hypothetical protein